jgi:DNA ligase-associated metallophosphoesterase
MVPLSFASFSLAGHDLALVDGRALFWPAEQALVVADLHLEKASHFASLGQMLPPWDSRETLERLERALAATGARRVYCLGDSFHDVEGPERLEAGAGELLGRLTRAAEWVWITGNHDEFMGGGMSDRLGGTLCDELRVGGVILRHQAVPGEEGVEFSGHFHPRHAMRARSRRIARPCAVASETRLILPAFGALTGGLDARDPAILAALRPAGAIDALVAAGESLARFALWREGG